MFPKRLDIERTILNLNKLRDTNCLKEEREDQFLGFFMK